MNITRLSIRNAQFVIIMLLILLVLSIRSFIVMPRSEDPQVSFPIYVATIAYPGTSPEDMETLIVDPLEEAIERVNNITEIETDIREGVAVISIEAEFGLDTEKKYDELLREINLARPRLPSGIFLFDFQQIKPEERVNFILYTLTSESSSYKELNDLAEDLEAQIERVKGVNDVKVEASPERQVRISLDFERMTALNITLPQIIGTLQANNVNIPGGDISVAGKNFSIKSTGSLKSIEEIKKTVLTSINDRLVYLKDIADVDFDYEDTLWKAAYNGEKSVFISMKLKKGQNILQVDKEVNRVAQTFAASLPPSISLNTSFEQASAVKARINDFFINLLQGIGLVGVIIFIFLGWRAAIIIVTLIPICAILALAILNNNGYGLQQISIASLVLALGLLVDNGIVVIENISRFIKEGMPKQQAAIKGATEVGFAIVSSTVTTLLSFFPLTQLGEGAGLFLMSLPLTVIFTLVISLVLALSFSPIMSNWLMSSKLRDKPSLADRLVEKFTTHVYRPSLEFSLKFGWLIVLIAVVVTAFSVSLFPKIGVSFFPTADKPLLIIDIDAPRGSSLAETEDAIHFVEEILDTMAFVLNYTSNIGNSNPQIYYNRIPKQYEKRHGQVLVNLTQWDQEKFYRTIATIRRAAQEYPAAMITVEELKNGVPVDAPIEIRIIGEDLSILKDMALRVEKILGQTAGVINIVNPLKRNQTQLQFALDKEKAGLFNVSELEFDQTVRSSLNGLTIDQVTLDDDEEYDVIVRMPFDEHPSLADFNKIYVANRQGRSIPLHHVASLQFQAGTAEFAHLDLERNVGVTASLSNLDITIATTLEVIEELEKMTWPEGYRYFVGGEFREQQNTFGSLGVILILAQIAIFAVLVLQFRSVLQPMIVFAAIPLAVSGSFIALYLTGWSFSFFAFVGLISLIGIVVNNSIILVDYINQLQRSGVDMREAILTGASRRFKPIVLTTLTTILGLAPLALQATNQWSPLCMTIIGGMISSTLLSLLIVPILYNWFSKPLIQAGA